MKIHKRYALFRTAFCALTLLFCTEEALASKNCETYFRSGINDQTHQLRFATGDNFDGQPPADVLAKIRATVQEDGFQFDRQEVASDGTHLYFRPKEGTTAHNYPLEAIATKSSVVVLAASLPPSAPPDAEDIKAEMCAILAKAGPTPASTGAGDARTAPPGTARQANALRPSVGFDAKAAKESLEEGTSTITGTACVVRSGQVTLASNRKVMLYPATPYMEEVVKLMHKVKSGDTIDWPAEARDTRLEGMTNANGQFRFAKMKPGRYYLFTTLSSSVVRSRDVNVGRGVSGDIGVDYYEKQNYQTSYEDLLEKFVDVSKDGETVDITLSPRRKLKLIGESGAAGIFGCR
jgi:hypothetical protein